MNEENVAFLKSAIETDSKQCDNVFEWNMKQYPFGEFLR